MNPKQIAAERAVSYIQSGMTVGLGTGTTNAYAIAAIGERLHAADLSDILCVPTSNATAMLAKDNGIPLGQWDSVRRLDVTIDGADEVDPQFRLIKGGGGALVREKIVAAASDTLIIIVDESKVKQHLGAFPLPVTVFPFGWQCTRDRLENAFNCPVTPRKASDGSLFLSDDGLYIADLHFAGLLPDPDTLEERIKTIVGVVEVGLFVRLCDRVIVGHNDGHLEELVLPQ